MLLFLFLNQEGLIMPNISISPSSLEFIDSLYDGSLTVRRLLQLAANCAENASNAKRGGEPFTIDSESLYGTIDHALRMLDSIEIRTQQLWKEVGFLGEDKMKARIVS